MWRPICGRLAGREVGRRNQPRPGNAPRRTRGRRPGTVPPPGRYQCQTLLYKPEQRVREQPRVGLRDGALLHSAGEEGGPGELDVAHARRARAGVPPPRAATCAGRAIRPSSATSTRLRRTSCSVRSNSPLSRRTSVGPNSPRLRGQRLEPLPFGLQRLGMNLEQTVELGLEVVVQRRRAEADVWAMSAHFVYS